jgi:signal transduction histidine kinase
MKTTFSRYFATTAALLLVMLMALGLAFRAMLGGYLVDQKRESLSSNATAVAELAAAYDSAGELEANWDFRISLSFAANVSGTDVLILDEDGMVVLCSDADVSCDHLGKILDDAYTQAVCEGGAVYSACTVEGLYDEARYLMGVPIVSSATGENIGIVLVSSPSRDIASLLLRTTLIFFWTAVAVLLLAMLLTWIVARSQARPLGALAAAAHRFGHGDLSTRVTVGKGSTNEVKDLANAFNTMAESLEQSERQRQEFVANVSHELKTPMTTIAGFMDGMLDGTIPPEKHPQYMKTVSDEVKRLSRLVRSMLDVSRLRAQPNRATFAAFDVCETAGQALLTFEQKINAKHLEVEVDFPDEGCRVLAEPDAITQVVTNLIDNAVKFAAPDGALRLSVQESGGKALVSVANTGDTIPPDELSLIFDRFHKTDKSRSVDRDGVGLGLYIVRTILDNHAETINVTSENGLTTFTFTLTLAK